MDRTTPFPFPPSRRRPRRGSKDQKENWILSLPTHYNNKKVTYSSPQYPTLGLHIRGKVTAIAGDFLPYGTFHFSITIRAGGKSLLEKQNCRSTQCMNPFLSYLHPFYVSVQFAYTLPTLGLLFFCGRTTHPYKPTNNDTVCVGAGMRDIPIAVCVKIDPNPVEFYTTLWN